MDIFPLPRIDDCLDSLRGNVYFSTLDLASGYWQIAMEETSREKTAFAIPDGTYQFNIMPFGLANVPSAFQRFMQKVLEGLIPWTTLMMCWCWEPHLQTTWSKCLLSRLRDAGLKLKPTKCTLVRPEVTYLGYIVMQDGVKIPSEDCSSEGLPCTHYRDQATFLPGTNILL